MAGAQRPPESGRDEGHDGQHGQHGHLLGPHVVGQRVVVRRLLRGETGPTGGPAFTDVLGTCLSWGDGRTVVAPESGETVTIAIADIVSGKPVPPRASTRMRVGVREAELHTASLWPGLSLRDLGEWQLRADPAATGRPLKRANSCLAVGDPGLPTAEALASVTAFYAEVGRPPLLQVEADSATEAAVVDAGWLPLGQGESDFLLASVARVRRALPRHSRPVELAATGPRAVASIGDGCDPLAEGRVAVDGDWAGLHSLTVDPGHRRRGLAGAVVGELLDWAAEQGALTAWLHVETDNPGATAFWEALGFLPHHTCRYYVPAAT